MKLYIAGIAIPWGDMIAFRKKFPDIHILNSYLEVKSKASKDILDGIDVNRFFLDSGAFSAFTLGKKINLKDYCEFIKKNKFKIYAGLDVIGDHVKTRENIEIMEKMGLKPIPTFHYNSPMDELKRMIKKYDYIALGGLVPLSTKKVELDAWLSKCFYIIRDKVKVHGFGLNALWAWKKFPFYSVDATSWVCGSKFRRIVEYKNGKIITHAKALGNKHPLRLFVMTANYVDLNVHNIIEYYKAKDFVTSLWEKRGIKWQK